MSRLLIMDNSETWGTSGIADAYAEASHQLFPAELSLLQDLAGVLPDADLLDIGIGTGRTTIELASKCRRYVGVDYSQAMIDRATSRFPGLDLRLADARSLADFADGSFDLVVFSFNGIDYVSHDDRLVILREIRRVLRDGGRFAFSTHRLGVKVPRPMDASHLRPALDPRRTVSAVKGYVAGIANGRAMRPLEAHFDGYALLNDPAHEYRLLTYYVTPREQVRQLNEAGFALVRGYRFRGERVPAAEITTTSYDDRDFMLHYLAAAAPID